MTTSNPKTCTGTCDGSVNIGGQYVDHYRTLPTTMSWPHQDGFNNLDASILKDFSLPRESYFELRFETFNTLNHPIFAAPNVSSATASNFGEITSTEKTACRARSRSAGAWSSNRLNLYRGAGLDNHRDPRRAFFARQTAESDTKTGGDLASGDRRLFSHH